MFFQPSSGLDTQNMVSQTGDMSGRRMQNNLGAIIRKHMCAARGNGQAEDPDLRIADIVFAYNNSDIVKLLI